MSDESCPDCRAHGALDNRQAVTEHRLAALETAVSDQGLGGRLRAVEINLSRLRGSVTAAAAIGGALSGVIATLLARFIGG